jgi:hypothetical protein
MRGNQGRAAKGDFNYAHVYTFAQELRKSTLNKAQKELFAAFLARVFKRRMFHFDLDNFMAMCLGLTEGKNAAHVHDSFINGCICQKRERCDIPGPAVPTVGAD